MLDTSRLPSGIRRKSAAGRERPADRVYEASPAALYLAAALLLASAAIHLWAMPGHFLAWWGYGALFLAGAAAQGLFTVLVLRWPVSGVCLGAIGVNLVLVSLYIVSHTRGVPFGPHAGGVEEAGMLDTLAAVAGVGAMVYLVSLLRGLVRAVAINALLLAGGAFWALRISGLLP
jgi:hypothetical protein